MAALRIAGVIPESIVDGPGIRYVLFVQGCPHHCPGCHNPQTHDPSGGQETTTEALLDDICKRPYVHAVTLSGGEPFCQAKELTLLAAQLKARGFHLMCYSGFTLEQLLARPDARALLEQLDLLVDGPFVEARRDIALRFRGSDNQRVLDVPASLAKNAPVWCEKYR